MSFFRTRSRQHDIPLSPPSPSLLSPPTNSSSRSPSPDKPKTTLHGNRSVPSLLREDSEWSPSIPRALAKDMPALPDRYALSIKSSKPIDPSQNCVWLFDNIAFRVDSAPEACRFAHQKSYHAFVNPTMNAIQPPLPPVWQVECVAAYFAEKLDHDPTMAAQAICRKLMVARDNSAFETIKQRLEPFVTPILPRYTVRIGIDNIETQTLGPGSSFGISSSVNRMHFDPPSLAHQTITTSAVPNPYPNTILPCTTLFAEPTGWAIISAIDDTLKQTGTTSPLSILKSTFLDPPTPIAGMAQLYNQLDTLLASPIWFYLSASPYLLYAFLRDFRIKFYPPGTLILRDASWQNLGGLVSSLVLGVHEYKINRMMKLHGWFPKRRLICIGDSTQRDPEAYAETAKRFPGWVRGIFIRRVRQLGVGRGSGSLGEEEKNGDNRFQRAFGGLRGVVCFVFDEPVEVEERIMKMLDDEDVIVGAGH